MPWWQGGSSAKRRHRPAARQAVESDRVDGGDFAVRYQTFRLLIQSDPAGGCSIHALTPKGEGRARFDPPADGLLAGLPLGRHDLQALGERLFESLFHGEVLRLYERSLGLLEADPEVGLRIELMMDPRDQEFAAVQALPWELLRQPGKPDFLALDPRRPVVRYLAVAQPVDATARPNPLRILAVAANPSHPGLSPLDVDQELENLREAVRLQPDIELVTPDAPTLSALRLALLEKHCHVFHFMGHGGADGAGQEKVLFFETEEGFGDPVRSTDLVNKLAGFPTVRLAVLNACDSAVVPEGVPGRTELDSFSGVASSLVLGGMPAVVAMQFPISDRGAIAFGRTFYQRLAAGSEVEAAVAEGRQAMHSVDSGSYEWATPVLFMRAPSGASSGGLKRPRYGLFSPYWLSWAWLPAVVLLAVWVGYASFGKPQDKPPHSPAAPIVQPLILRGEILDAATRNPLPGVLVQLPELRLQVVTDTMGQYRFELVQGATTPVKLRASLRGYTPLNLDLTPGYGNLNVQRMWRVK